MNMVQIEIAPAESHKNKVRKGVIDGSGSP
jgi:hypothetical protein